MNLMIVDDETLERDVLMMIIKKEQLMINHLGEAKNGLDAVNIAKGKNFDVVLMDIEMPVMDGVTAATIIKKESPNCNIIFLTAKDELDINDSLFSRESNDYLLKPAHPSEIIHTLKKYMPIQQSTIPSNLDIVEFCRHSEIIKVMEYIKDNLHLELKLDALAELVHFNGQYLSRLFKQQTNYTVTQYITACRIEKAKSFLRYSSEDTVLEVSKKCGFVDSNYFSRVFKKCVGISPSQFQNQAYFNRNKRMNSFNNFLM